MLSRSKKTLIIGVSIIITIIAILGLVYVVNNIYENSKDDSANNQQEISNFEVIPTEGNQPATE